MLPVTVDLVVQIVWKGFQVNLV